MNLETHPDFLSANQARHLTAGISIFQPVPSAAEAETLKMMGVIQHWAERTTTPFIVIRDDSFWNFDSATRNSAFVILQNHGYRIVVSFDEIKISWQYKI